MGTQTGNGTARRRRMAGAGMIIVGVVAALLGLALAGPATADPKGNNGTVKIDGVTLGDGQANEPHVGCGFAVEFFGYDKGDLNASVTFELQAPTLRPSGSQVLLTDTVAIGEDAAGGATDRDASKLYQLDFSGVTPQAQQGYHVKVTVHAAGSKGADTKHKVFWVQPCETPTTTTSTTTTTTVPTSSTTVTTAAPNGPTSSTTSTTTTTEVVAGTTTSTAPTQVLGTQEERPVTTLAGTGSDIGILALVGGLALVLGGLALLGTKRDRSSAVHGS